MRRLHVRGHENVLKRLLPMPVSTTSRLRAARARIAWCIVGTAVYQLGLASFIQAKHFSALNPGEQKIEAPAPSELNTAAMRP